MSGTEQAKTKENVAAIMRAKQLAGTFVFFSFPPLFCAKSVPAVLAVNVACVSCVLWAVLISRAAEAKKAEEAGKK